MLKIYVCEVSGNDENDHKNSAEFPFKTAIRAVQFAEDLNSTDYLIFVKKEQLLIGTFEFEEISTSQLKKAKKGLEILVKKIQKQNEFANKDAQSKIDEQMRLNQAK